MTQSEALPRPIFPRTRMVKKSIVDNLLIGQELHAVQSTVMKQKGAALLLNGHGPLCRQPCYRRGKRSIVKPDRAILNTPEITQGGGGIPCRGFMFRTSISLVAIPPHQ